MLETDPSKRVVITGRGAVTPIGLNVRDFWANTVAGCTGIDYLPEEMRSRRIVSGARIKDYSEHGERGVHRAVQFALTATEEALTEAGLDEYDYDPEDMAAIVSTGWGGASHVGHMQNLINENRRLSRDDLLLVIPCRTATVLTMKKPIFNAAYTLNDACASALAAIIDAVKTIKVGDAKIVITGGSEACVNKLGIEAFDAQSALSREVPEFACQPFVEEGADGFVLGEGAGILILESLEHVRARKAEDKIIAEIISYKHCSDSLRIDDPKDLEEIGLPADYKRNPNVEPSIAGAIASMSGCLKKADFAPEDIDFISTHGTGTRIGNRVESLAIKRVFGEHRLLDITAGKERTGHMVAGDGTRVIAATKAMQTGIIPHILGLKESNVVRVGRGLNFVMYEPRRYLVGKLRNAIIGQYGFGGPSIAVIISLFEG